jgi:hypothetical protein
MMIRRSLAIAALVSLSVACAASPDVETDPAPTHAAQIPSLGGAPLELGGEHTDVAGGRVQSDVTVDGKAVRVTIERDILTVSSDDGVLTLRPQMPAGIGATFEVEAKGERAEFHVAVREVSALRALSDASGKIAAPTLARHRVNVPAAVHVVATWPEPQRTLADGLLAGWIASLARAGVQAGGPAPAMMEAPEGGGGCPSRCSISSGAGSCSVTCVQGWIFSNCATCTVDSGNVTCTCSW